MTINKEKAISSLRYFILIFLLGAFSSTSFADDDKKDFDVLRNVSIFNSLLRELDRYYVDSIDAEKMVTNGINAMLSQIDPYTTYIPKSEREDFQTMTTGEYGGIGSIIQQKGDSVLISEPYEGMPAQEVGLRPGDVILAIDGESMLKKATSEVSDKLRGEANTSFVITIGREGVEEPFDVNITRRKITLNPVTYSGMINDSIGYIYLTSFTDKAAREVRNSLVELQKNPDFKGLVLDLRNNPGGILEDAIEIVNLFVPKGKTVLETRGKVSNWDRVYKTTQEPIAPDLPLVVMIDQGSASASEIVSGALQDLDRAVVIGDRSFGKGLVQTTRPISYDGLLKVTTSKYYIPSGRLIQEIDYGRRNPDGSIARRPDSLAQVFYTENNRPVKDGGGITPDVTVKLDKMPNLVLYLLGQQLIFDYANQFAAKHDNIGAIADFHITDSMYDEFKAYVKSKNFTYDRESDKALKQLERVAEFEGYSEGAAAEFKALAEKLKHDIDRDLDTFRPEIEKFLADEIVRRYYYQKGEVEQSLKKDVALKKAKEILANKEEYDKILNLTKKK